MDAIPLSAPDGTIFSYACGKCRHVSTHSSRWTDYEDEDVAYFAEGAKYQAERCCRCEHCKSYWSWHHTERKEINGVQQPFDCCDACFPAYAEKLAAHRAKWEAERFRVDAAREETLTKSKDRDRAMMLQEQMSDISESQWCAGWLVDLEFLLWEALETSAVESLLAGRAFILGDDDRSRLTRLSEEAGGWWNGRDQFVTFPEWLEIYAKWFEDRKAQRAARLAAKGDDDE